jgi:hypothetical protein
MLDHVLHIATTILEKVKDMRVDWTCVQLEVSHNDVKWFEIGRNR